jgi:3-deoxy-D-manno-octulosonate 8-phosphate phosphatase (KDO 8-P phosphatase)
LPKITADIQARLEQVQLLLLDVDGVLTDGGIIYNAAGEEIKRFHVKDGLGIRLLMETGIRVGIITGRRSPALTHRLNNLGIELVLDGIHDKAAALTDITARVGVDNRHISFLGDDLPDLPVMKRVGLAVAVADACYEVKESAHMITAAGGGKGAVRELCEAVLKAKGLWEGILERFLTS